MGKAIGVAYAATVKGFEAAIDFVTEFKDTILTLCCGAKVSIHCFPSGNQSKGQRRQKEPITNFARTSILNNTRHCNDHFMVLLLDGLNSNVMNKAVLNNMMATCKHLIAVAFTLVRLPKNNSKTYNYGYAVQSSNALPVLSAAHRLSSASCSKGVTI